MDLHGAADNILTSSSAGASENDLIRRRRVLCRTASSGTPSVMLYDGGCSSHRWRPDKPSTDTTTAAHRDVAADATAAGDAGVRVVAIWLAARGGSARPGWLPQRHRPAGSGR